jgi:hypothetical protein
MQFPQVPDKEGEQAETPIPRTAVAGRQVEAEARSVVVAEQQHEAPPAVEGTRSEALQRAKLADDVFSRLAEEEATPIVLADRRTDLVILAAFLAGIEPWMRGELTRGGGQSRGERRRAPGRDAGSSPPWGTDTAG